MFGRELFSRLSTADSPALTEERLGFSERRYVSFIQQRFATFTDPCGVKNHVNNLDVSRVPSCLSVSTMTLFVLLSSPLLFSSSPPPPSGSDSPSRWTPGEMVSPSGERTDSEMKRSRLFFLHFESRSQSRFRKYPRLRLICPELVSSGGSESRGRLVIPVLQNPSRPQRVPQQQDNFHTSLETLQT